MIDLYALVEELKRQTAWQRLPQAIEDGEYLAMVIDAIKYLYVITGRGGEDIAAMVEQTESVVPLDPDDPDNTETVTVPVATFTGTLNLTEEYIVLCKAQITLLEKVRQDKNAIVGYTTDALTVTHADKPFQYISGTIQELKREIRLAFYKLVTFSGGV